MDKEAQKVIFSWKLTKLFHSKIIFNNTPSFCANLQKHLGMYLDHALIFSYHIKEKISKAMKGTDYMKKTY